MTLTHSRWDEDKDCHPSFKDHPRTGIPRVMAFWDFPKDMGQAALVVKNPLANAGDMRLGFSSWVRKTTGSHRVRHNWSDWACKNTGVAQLVKNPPAMRKTWVRSLDWEDPLEEGMATHSSVLAWRIPVDRGAWRAAVCGVGKNRTQHSTAQAVVKQQIPNFLILYQVPPRCRGDSVKI